MDNILCFIFDLDNTLVFNKQANFAAYQDAFSHAGLALTENDFSQYFDEGSDIEHIYQSYITLHKLHYDPETLEKIKAQKSNTYATFFHMSELNNTAAGLLQALAPHYFTALATSASKKNAQALLEYFDLDRFFKYTIFGDDVVHKKPDPECFQKIASHFAVEPKQCIIFEDSEKGFKAAEAFGGHICKVVR